LTLEIYKEEKDELLYYSEWEKLMCVGFELICTRCNTIIDDEAQYEYHDEPLLEFLIYISKNLNKYYLAPIEYYCSDCYEALEEVIKMKVHKFKYIQPFTMEKRIKLDIFYKDIERLFIKQVLR